MDSMTLVKRYLPQQKQVARLPKRDLIQEDITLGELLTKHFSPSTPSQAEVVPLTMLLVWSDKYGSNSPGIFPDALTQSYADTGEHESLITNSSQSFEHAVVGNNDGLRHHDDHGGNQLECELELEHRSSFPDSESTRNPPYSSLKDTASESSFHHTFENLGQESLAEQTIQILATGSQQSSPTLPVNLPVNTTITRKV